MLFRSEPKTGSSVDEPDPGRLVLLLLLLETATSGVHKAAFVGALGLANRVSQRFSSGGGITVLGPTFSGSTPSLVLALEEAFQRGGSSTARGIGRSSGSSPAERPTGPIKSAFRE